MRKTIIYVSFCACAAALCACASISAVLQEEQQARSPVLSKLHELCRRSQPVSVAVLCEARTSLSFESIVIQGYDARTWPESVCAETQGKVEQELLAAFGRTKGFRLVDRSLMPSVLAEQRLAVSGLVMEEARLQPGRLAGASHLLMIEETLHGKPGLLDDEGGGLFGAPRRWPRTTRVERLIEAQSGTVLATERKEL